MKDFNYLDNLHSMMMLENGKELEHILRRMEAGKYRGKSYEDKKVKTRKRIAPRGKAFRRLEAQERKGHFLELVYSLGGFI